MKANEKKENPDLKKDSWGFSLLDYILMFILFC